MEEFAYVLEIDYLCSGIQGHSTGPRVYTQKSVLSSQTVHFKQK